MDIIVTVQDAVTAFEPWMEPTPADLAAIDEEMPAIKADIEADMLADQITILDRFPSLDERHIRRTRNRLLVENRDLANRAAAQLGGAA